MCIRRRKISNYAMGQAKKTMRSKNEDGVNPDGSGDAPETKFLIRRRKCRKLERFPYKSPSQSFQ
jgi:hypothetical protein